MAKAFGREWLRDLRRLAAAALWMLGVLLLHPIGVGADEIRPDDWWRVDQPTKAQCDAAAELDKQTSLWYDVCVRGGLAQTPKGPPTKEQQELAWEAEKACSGKTFEDAKDHDAFKDCLTNYKVEALLASNEAIRQRCAKMSGVDPIVCADFLYSGATAVARAVTEQGEVEVWIKKIEEELAARRSREPPRPQPVPLAAVPTGRSADPRSTITGIGSERDAGQDIRGYDSQHQTIVGADGRKVDIKPMIAALQKVSPEAAKNPFVASDDGSTLRFSPDVQRTLVRRFDELNKVGGVALDVTFQNLALLGVPDMRTTGPATLIENPIMISLQRLVAAAKPYADTPEHWRKLPEDIRYPGALGRVHGYVLDPAKKDVFIIGTAAKTPEARLDIDLITVLMETVWAKGLVPRVSLDPTPSGPNAADSAGPQYVRITDLPKDALVSRILLDADYEMKRINFGLVNIADPNFKRSVDILKAEGKGHSRVRDRFWFHPVPLNANSVRVSGSGRVVLYDAGVQLLTERLETVTGSGTGEVDPLADRAAAEFTKAFPRLESSEAIKPRGVFSLLHGITDIVTMWKILHDSEIDYSVLHELRLLPYRHLSGAEAVPLSYPGLTVPYRQADGVSRQLSGGVQLRIRKTRRALDRFEDNIAVRLERAAADFRGDGFVQRVALTFRLATQQGGGSPTAMLKMDEGLKWLELDLPDEASVHFAEAAAMDPLDVDAWTYLALANALAGNEPQARSAMDHAEAIDPSDPFVRKVSVQMAFLADPDKFDFHKVDPQIRRDLSNDYAELAWALGHGRRRTTIAADVILKYADLAVKLWPENAQAYVARGMVHDDRDESDAALQDYNEAIRLEPAGMLGPTMARAFIARAKLFYDKEEYDRAVEDYTQAIRLDPKNVEALIDRGDAHRGQHDYDGALADYSEAIRIDPGYRSGVALLRRAPLFKGKRRYDLAIQDYTQAIALQKDPSRTFSDRAKAYEENGDLDHALADYGEIIRLKPDEAWGFRYRAEIYRKRGEYDRAIADYNKAIRLDPKDSDIYEERSQVFRDKGDFASLAAGYDEAIRADPKDPERYRERGKFWLAQGKVDRAVADYTKAITVDSDPANSYIERAEFWRDRGNADRALADYSEAIRVAPKLASSYIKRAEFWSNEGNLDRALADYSEALRLAPDEYDYYKYRARAWEKKGDVDRAIVDFTEAIRLDPREYVLFLDRAEAWQKKGDIDPAIADYTEAIRLRPDYSGAFRRRGAAYEIKGDLDHAIADFSEAIRFYPDDWEALENRSNAYRKKGDHDLATRDLRQAGNVFAVRGRARFYEGKFREASTTLLRANELDPNLHTILWLHLAQRRAGQDSTALAEAARLQEKTWPYPVIELYLGQRSADDILSATTSPEQRCDAQFYLGMWQLLRNKGSDAKSALQAAVDTCPDTTSSAFLGADAELRRLKP